MKIKLSVSVSLQIIRFESLPTCLQLVTFGPRCYTDHDFDACEQPLCACAAHSSCALLKLHVVQKFLLAAFEPNKSKSCYVDFLFHRTHRSKIKYYSYEHSSQAI